MKNTLQQTEAILKRYQIKANKRYGQNFLVDDEILHQIIEVSNIQEEDLVIEIGPGLGNLTEFILEKASYALLIEIDSNMVKIIQNRFCEKHNYKLIEKDILQLKLDTIIDQIERERGTKFNSVKVVANLPYYITTPILFQLLQKEGRIKTITVMVQKEVANRMVAHPKTKDYGILSLMTQYESIPEIQIEVPRTSFVPVPNVDSAVITLQKEKRYVVKEEELFFKLIHASFSMRRKKMINSLYNTKWMNLEKDVIEDIFHRCEIDLNTRAEELSMNQFIQISEELEKLNG